MIEVTPGVWVMLKEVEGIYVEGPKVKVRVRSGRTYAVTVPEPTPERLDSALNDLIARIRHTITSV